jgi:hypothetical protein
VHFRTEHNLSPEGTLYQGANMHVPDEKGTKYVEMLNLESFIYVPSDLKLSKMSLDLKPFSHGTSLVLKALSQRTFVIN